MEKAKVFLARFKPEHTQKDHIKIIEKLFNESGADKCFTPKELVAVKVHFGERGNKAFVSPKYIKPIVDKIKAAKAKPFLTDTNTLYVGARSNSVDHIQLAYEHGFKDAGAPIIISDGLLGNIEKQVKINGVHFNEVSIASENLNAHAVIVVSHFKGHLGAGFGGAIKNVGMGMSSRKGKMRQHSDMKPKVKTNTCTGCGVCTKWCPAKAIKVSCDKAKIAVDICIGCGECLTVCKFNAVEYNWKTSSRLLQEKMTEHALGVVESKKGKIFFINFINNVTKDCDCMGAPPQIIAPDVGIVASSDMIAIDQASLDLVTQAAGENVFAKQWQNVNHEIQLEHGEKIGAGTRQYELLEVQ